MDLQSLKDSLAGISLYDVKAAVRKAQNVVMNYTEMEAKVREATNNEPWGASSSLMQEIANGTYNYQLLNEIMPMVYKRFNEKTAEEWRQIYKALQLLEFLVKNGSEQVIDDARSNLSTIKMLRQFHYIDPNGKDQGVNVRNRAKELGELLGDVDKIRAERKKARANKNKYSGVEGGGGFSGGFSSGGFSGSSSRYGGFGSDSGDYGGYSSNTVYGDGGGFGGASNSRGYHDEGTSSGGGYGNSRPDSRQKYEEYDEYDEGASSNNRDSSAGRRGKHTTSNSITKATSVPTKKTTPAASASPAAPAVDLLFGDDPAPTVATKGKQTSTRAPTNAMNEFDDFMSSPAEGNNANDDDDFDDFQAAPAPAPAPAQARSNILSNFSAPSKNPINSITSAPATFAAPQPLSSQQAMNITGLVGMTTPNIQKSGYAPPPIQGLNSNAPAVTPVSSFTSNSGYKAPQSNFYGSPPLQPTPSSSVLTPTNTNPGSGKSTPSISGASKKPGDAFGSIWASAASTAIKKPSSIGSKPATPASTTSLAEMAKEKAQNGLWGSPVGSTPSNQEMGSFSGMGNGNTSGGARSGGNLDDLLG